MKPFKLDTPKSLSQRVMLRLREAIIDGEFELGAVISEEMIARSFGVSRTPVREAMGQLQLQGLVVIRPQVGSFVFTPSAADISALCAFRKRFSMFARRLILPANLRAQSLSCQRPS